MICFALIIIPIPALIIVKAREEEERLERERRINSELLEYFDEYIDSIKKSKKEYEILEYLIKEKKIMDNKLLEYFDVNNFDELIDYMEKNPEDEKVKSLQEVLDYIETIEEGEIDG